MAMQYEWALRRYPTAQKAGDFDQVVTSVFFSVFAYDDANPTGRRGRYEGHVFLPAPAPIPAPDGTETYEQLQQNTEAAMTAFMAPAQAGRADVLAWAKAALGESGVATAEAMALEAYSTALEPVKVNY